MANILVGSVRFPLARLIDSDGSMVPELITSLELLLPSGRPQGKIRLKLAINERSHRSPPPPPPPPPPPLPSRRLPLRPQQQNYYSTPPNNHYHSPTPQGPFINPSPHRDCREFSQSRSPYHFPNHYYSGYYYPPPPPHSLYYNLLAGLSAPVDAPLAPPRFSNYGPPPSGPSAPVQGPPMGSRLSSYGGPSGPSAPVDYSLYDDHRRLEEERGAAERSESEFGAQPNYTYRRERRG